MKRFLLLSLAFLFSAGLAFGQIYAPDGLNMPGSWDSWSQPPTVSALKGVQSGGTLDTIVSGTRRWHTTIHCASSGGDVQPGTFGFLFTSGPSNSYYKNKWGDVTVTMNALQTYTYQGSNNNSITLNDGKWYTVNWKDVGYQNTQAIFMETSAKPVTIDTVTQSPAAGVVADNDSVTVTVTINTSKSSEENIYVRYSTDNWSTSHLAAVTFSGTKGTATIPAQSAGAAVSYYVFSTTITNPASSDVDMETINYNNNGGSNYSYNVKHGTVQDGDWNNTATWKSGTVPSSGDTVVLSNKVTVANYGVSSPAVCSGLIVNSGAYLTINPEQALTVSGDLTNNGTITLASDNTGNGSLIVDGTATGNVTVQRYIPGYTSNSDGWHLVSVPFDADPANTSFDPTGGSTNDLYSWDEATNTWDNYRQATFTFSRGDGYLMAQKTNTTNSITGTLSNSDVAMSNLSYNPGLGNGSGWHLLGNPFTSAVKWGGANWSLNNVAATAKIWSNSAGNYIDIVAGGIIPSTSGFFVQVTSGSNSLTIPATDRVHSTTNNYKNTSAGEGVLKFKVTGDANSYYDENTLGFKSGATTGFDPAYDSHMLFSLLKTAPQLWTVSNEQNFSINYLPPPSGTDSVQMDFQAGINSTYHLFWSGVNNIPNNFQVRLVDKKAGKTVNMRNVSNYNFTATTNDNTGRFVLRINGTTGIPETIASSKVKVYAVRNNVYIEAKNNLVLSGEATIINLAGQKVYRKTLDGSTQQVLNTQLNAGVYIVQVKMKGRTITRKIIIR